MNSSPRSPTAFPRAASERRDAPHIGGIRQSVQHHHAAQIARGKTRRQARRPRKAQAGSFRWHRHASSLLKPKAVGSPNVEFRNYVFFWWVPFKTINWYLKKGTAKQTNCTTGTSSLCFLLSMKLLITRRVTKYYPLMLRWLQEHCAKLTVFHIILFMNLWHALMFSIANLLGPCSRITLSMVERKEGDG